MKQNSNTVLFLVVQPVHLHRHTCAARSRKPAKVVSANMVCVALNRHRLHGYLDLQGNIPLRSSIQITS